MTAGHGTKFVVGLAVVALLGVGLAACAPLPPPGPCGVFYSNSKFDGWGVSPYLSYVRTNEYEGAAANITVRNALLCTTDTSEANNSSAWSMITDFRGWAQTGFLRAGPIGEAHFAQQSLDGTSWSTVFGSQVADGEVHHDWQQYDGGCGCIHSNVDVTRFMDSTFNPKLSWVYPYGAEFFGETKYLETNMPGWNTSQTTFSGLQVQNFSNDNGWYTPPEWSYWSSNDNTNRWNQGDPRESVGGNSFGIWNK